MCIRTDDAMLLPKHGRYTAHAGKETGVQIPRKFSYQKKVSINLESCKHKIRDVLLSFVIVAAF